MGRKQSAQWIVLWLVAWACGAPWASDSTTSRDLATAELSYRWLAKSTWRLLYADSQASMGTNGPARNAFDGNPDSFWHTVRSPTPAPMPHDLRIDLGGTHVVRAFRYWPRQDSASGRIGNYAFYVSADGRTWGKPVATGRWWAGRKSRWVGFTATTARYVRLVALSEINGNAWTALGELDINGAPAPSSTPNNNATLTWTAPATYTDGAPLTSLAGFLIYDSAVSGSYTRNDIAARVPASSEAAGTPQSFTLANLASGKHHFVVTAYDNAGTESAASAEVSKTID